MAMNGITTGGYANGNTTGRYANGNEWPNPDLCSMCFAFLTMTPIGRMLA